MHTGGGMLGILSGECEPVDTPLCVRPFVSTQCLYFNLHNHFRATLASLHCDRADLICERDKTTVGNLHATTVVAVHPDMHQ